MEKKQCKVNIIFFLTIICVLGAMAGSYFYYVMIYRQQTEPETDTRVTSREAVLYDLGEQVSVLKKFEDMYQTMKNNALEVDMGMIVIPGMKSTRTLESNQSDTISICTSMTPQGMCITEKYILVSAYCHTHRHNSVVYVIDKQSRQFVKEIVLKDKNHVGGLAYDSKHHMIWVATSHNGHAAASAFSLKYLEHYDLDKSVRTMAYTYDYDLYTLETDSFMTYADGYLYIGHFSMDTTSVVQKFKIGDNGRLETRSGAALGIEKDIAIPEEIKKIPKQVQGFAVYKDKVMLTQSYGWSLSKLLVYNYDDMMDQISHPYTQNMIAMPQKVQQIYIDGNDLYVLFESAAYAYRAQPLPKVDRICKLKLADVLKIDVEETEL